MTIIAKLSFWIMPKKNLRPALKKTRPFEEIIEDAFAQFKTEGYVERLKKSITQESLPANEDDLLDFLYNEIA